MEESMKVTIEEEPEMEEECEDIVIELTTAENGIATFTTDKICGELDALILSTTDKVHLRIDSELGYQILEMREYPHNPTDNKTTYINLRTQSWNEDGHQNGYAYDEFRLNEKLILYIEGLPGTTVKFIFRLED